MYKYVCICHEMFVALLTRAAVSDLTETKDACVRVCVCVCGITNLSLTSPIMTLTHTFDLDKYYLLYFPS